MDGLLWYSVVLYGTVILLGEAFNGSTDLYRQDIPSMFLPLSDVPDLTGTLKESNPTTNHNPNTNTNTKLLELAKYHFPNDECPGASRHFIHLILDVTSTIRTYVQKYVCEQFC